LCCKDGKIDKKAKTKVSMSKGKKSSHPKQLETSARYKGETHVLNESDLSTSSSIGINLDVSLLEEINLAKTWEPQTIENQYSIDNSSLVDASKSTLAVTSTSNTASTATNVSQPDSDVIVSRWSSHLGSLGTNSPQRPLTWNLNDSIGDSDDLPLPENLLTKIMPTKGARFSAKVLPVQVSTDFVQNMVEVAVRDETILQHRRAKGSDIILGRVEFSFDDIMECVEIV
jgi:hypothetical protein